MAVSPQKNIELGDNHFSKGIPSVAHNLLPGNNTVNTSITQRQLLSIFQKILLPIVGTMTGLLWFDADNTNIEWWLGGRYSLAVANMNILVPP
ncbi:MAG: hypothetical protein GXP08_06470 [Gammaproteobacteria bacterium]|nr:hypothetical protein [Gammaproteobacteria bacterium]